MECESSNKKCESTLKVVLIKNIMKNTEGNAKRQGGEQPPPSVIIIAKRNKKTKGRPKSPRD